MAFCKRLTTLLGTDYPIIQGPLGGFMTQKLAANVSNAGGLGSFGAHSLAPSAIQEVIGEIRQLTSKPFAMNLWVSMEDESAFRSSREAFERSLAPLADPIRILGGTLPLYGPYQPVRFEDQVRVLLDANVPVFSFIYGIPPREVLDECGRKGIVRLGLATTAEEAIALEQAGVDAIVASGSDAGGHRGSFLRSAEQSLTGTFSLVPQVVDEVTVPVIAAGGIVDARGVAAALALGAEGVQVGTAFLACRESGATELHRKLILSGQAGHTGLTKAFTGRLARGIENQLMLALNMPGVSVLPYPLQRLLVRNLTLLAEKAERSDLLPLWAGQGANLTSIDDAASLLRRLVSDVAPVAEAVQAWCANRTQRDQRTKGGS